MRSLVTLLASRTSSLLATRELSLTHAHNEVRRRSACSSSATLFLSTHNTMANVSLDPPYVELSCTIHHKPRSPPLDNLGIFCGRVVYLTPYLFARSQALQAPQASRAHGPSSGWGDPQRCADGVPDYGDLEGGQSYTSLPPIEELLLPARRDLECRCRYVPEFSIPRQVITLTRLSTPGFQRYFRHWRRRR
jgi:hypothetical protein